MVQVSKEIVSMRLMCNVCNFISLYIIIIIIITKICIAHMQAGKINCQIESEVHKKLFSWTFKPK